MSFSRDSGGEPLLHRWLDNWNGIGLIAAGMHYQGMRLSLSHIADGEWRYVFMGDTPRLAPKGYGVAATPWRAVHMAAWLTLEATRRRQERSGGSLLNHVLHLPMVCHGGVQ